MAESRHSPGNGVSVAISCGNNTDLAIGLDGHLYAYTCKWPGGPLVEAVRFGPATKKRFEELKSYLDSLSIHAVDA